MGRLNFNFMLSVDAQAGDQVDDLRDQIEAHGHIFSTTRSEFMPAPWFNLFSEGTSEAHPSHIADLSRHGYQLIELITEDPTLVTAEGLVWNYQTTDTNWAVRADNFVASAPFLTAAWCYSPGASRLIRRFVSRVADIDMGWGKRFTTGPRYVTPVHDFCFFGGMTTRRERVLRSFETAGYRIDIIPHSSTLAERDARIPHSRVVLDVCQYHWWDLVSSVRYTTALWCGRPVIAEARSLRARGRWDEVVRFAPEARFIETAVDSLGNWQALYADQLAALKKRPDMMAAAIAILPPPAASSSKIMYQPPDLKGPPPILVEAGNGMNFVQWRNRIYVIPQSIGVVHLESADLSGLPMIRNFSDIHTAKRASA